MRYEKGHKNETRCRILKVAGQLFCKHGISSIGIATIMKEAGLTNGAFYAHFKSKEMLVKEVLGSTLEEKNQRLLSEFERGTSLSVIITEYLSPVHRDHPEKGCTTSALASELCHHSKATKVHFTKKTEDTLKILSAKIEGNESIKNHKAIAVFSLMIGALQLSRNVADKELSDEILRVASKAAIQLAEN